MFDVCAILTPSHGLDRNILVGVVPLDGTAVGKGYFVVKVCTCSLHVF